VYELTLQGSSWIENILYTFTHRPEFAPRYGVILDASGNLYGPSDDTIFHLSRSGSQWIESTLYTFGAPGDASTMAGGLIFDASGNLYGASVYGGASDDGAIFRLTPSGGGWTERVLYSLDGSGGSQPMAGIVRDAAGNLYGTTCYGGSNNRGVVFRLSPAGGGQWTESVLHNFTGTDGGCPHGDLVLDAAGNVYGTTMNGGTYGVGVIFEITP